MYVNQTSPLNVRVLLNGLCTDHVYGQSLSGPWSSQQDIAPPAVRTWYSQNSYDLPLGSNAIYMGDRWRSDQLGSSTYVWYPLDFSSGSPQLIHADVWSVNLAAGEYASHSVGPTYGRVSYRLPLLPAAATARLEC